MNGIKSFEKLAKYGPTGVNIALVIAIIFIVWLMMGFLNDNLAETNKVIKRNTEVIGRLEGAFTELKTFLMLKDNRDKP